MLSSFVKPNMLSVVLNDLTHGSRVEFLKALLRGRVSRILGVNGKQEVSNWMITADFCHSVRRGIDVHLLPLIYQIFDVLITRPFLEFLVPFLEIQRLSLTGRCESLL